MKTDLDSSETDDLYLGAFYSCMGATLVRRRKEGQKVIFVFSHKTETMSTLRERYFMGEKVPCYEYSREVRRMKELVFT